MVLSNERAIDAVQAIRESTALLSADCERGTKDNTHTRGSSILGTVLNFTNSIVGAGAIGLGGAFAASGGLFSIACIIFFAYLAKVSLDMVVNLSKTTATPGTMGSYERVGEVTFGKPGFLVVLVSKFVYSFGSMIVYIVIVNDNFASAMEHLVNGKVTNRNFTETDGSQWTLASLLDNDDLMTLLLSATIVLPLCLLRDMTPLEKFSAVKVLSVAFIVLIVVYLFVRGDVRFHEGTFYQHWFEIRAGCLESLGTFVFTFVAQHTVHLTYNSLRQELRNVESWSVVSSFSIIIAAILSLALGISVYMTFWEKTNSIMFELYPPLASVDVAKLLLSVMMMLTYPLALFSCRELIIASIPIPKEGDDLLPIIVSGRKAWWLLPHDDKQLIRSLHVMVTVVLWGISTELAIRAPSLGDVLNVVGCVAGTVIAYFLPGLFDIKVNGYSHLAMLLLVVGTSVGLVGTYSSLTKLVRDWK